MFVLLFALLLFTFLLPPPPPSSPSRCAVMQQPLTVQPPTPLAGRLDIARRAWFAEETDEKTPVAAASRLENAIPDRSPNHRESTPVRSEHSSTLLVYALCALLR